MPDSISVHETILDAIFTSAQDGIFVIDENGYYVNANPYACELVGYSLADLCQMHTSDLRFPEDIAGSKERLASVIEAGGAYLPEFRLKHKSGSEIWVSMTATPMSVNNQILILGITRDITQPRETELALRESESRYRTLFEQATNAIVILDIDTLQIIDANEQAHLHLGFARDEIIQQPIFNLVADFDNVMHKHLKATTLHGFATHEIALKMKNDKTIYTLMSTRTVILDGKNRFLVMWRDITQMKQIEDSLYFTSQQGWQENDDNFLDALVIYLTEKLDIDYAFIRVVAR